MKSTTLLLLATCAVASVCRPAGPGLTAGPEAAILKDGKPYRAIGVNYFNCFLRTLAKAEDTSYEQGFRLLGSNHVPFVRFAACGFWPRDMKLYREDPGEYFRRLDGVVKAAEASGVGLIASLCWLFSCIPDLAGEPMDQWGNPQSRTHAFMRTYVREVVTRYKASPALWGWELGNEYGLQANLPNATEHRARILPSLGTPATRSGRDDLTFEMARAAFVAFASEVRKHDPTRIIDSGDSFPRLEAWHIWKEGRWKRDTMEQFAEMLTLNNPDPLDVISLHAYEDDDQRFAVAMDVSRKLGKPVFVGEFGAQGTSPEQAAKFRRLLKAIEDHGIPLAAVWVFDLASQPDFTVTPGNGRWWQIEEIAAANRRLGAMPGP